MAMNKADKDYVLIDLPLRDKGYISCGQIALATIILPVLVVRCELPRLWRRAGSGGSCCAKALMLQIVRLPA